MNQVMMAKLNQLPLLFLPIVLYGFGQGLFKTDELSEAQDFMDHVAQITKPHQNIQTVYDIKLFKYTPYILNENVQDPFAIKNFVSVDGKTDNGDLDGQCKPEQCGDGAPLPHIPYYLENFSLDQITMVGTLKNRNGQREALIKTPDGTIIQSKIGEYIGKNNGLIMNISPREITIQEKLRAGEGWKNRINKIQLIR